MNILLYTLLTNILTLMYCNWSSFTLITASIWNSS